MVGIEVGCDREPCGSTRRTVRHPLQKGMIMVPFILWLLGVPLVVIVLLMLFGVF